MFKEDIEPIVNASRKKLDFLDSAPLAYFILSCLAGVYVGFGIVLIFSVGGPIAADGGGAFLKLIMGASFGVALSLVIFAGSELFTGNNMSMTIGALDGRLRWGEVGKLFFICYLGNLAGSIFIAWLVVQGGSLAMASQELVVKVSSMKMNAGAWELFIRGILCNWLVCLAVWTASRTKNDAAKLILIFWCLFAFIASGFEHCVANMTVLGMGLMLPHGIEVSLMGMIRNLTWVSLGNMVGGGVFVGMVYWFASQPGPVRQPRESEMTPLAPVKETLS